MEILSSSIRGPAPLGPAASRQDLAALLVPGRVLAGIVLEGGAANRFLIGIGPHQVQADSPVALQVGRPVLLRVAALAAGEAPVLDVLGAAQGGDTPLLRALRAVVGEDKPVGRLLLDLAARLAGESGVRVRQLAGELPAHVYRPGTGGAALRSIVDRMGLGHEAALLAALRARGAGRPAAELAANLKAMLLGALEELPEGPAREAVARALAGVEAEQLLNLARRDAGEPLHLSFPVPDDSQWATAHVFVRPDRERDGDEPRGEGDGAVRRLTVGAHFSRTGPVRADVWLRPDRLDVRLSVEREDVAERIRAELPALTEGLAAKGRAVQVVVGVSPHDLVELEERAADIRFLRDHHLMDVSG